MGEVKLFRIDRERAFELSGKNALLEKPLQRLIEKNLYSMLGIRLLQSEYDMGKVQGGRIDTLGLDENNCPVVLEYKRNINKNVISQSLYYVHWLLNNRAEFSVLVMKVLGSEYVDLIDWTATRVICIASDFSKYDASGIHQISPNIELIRYRFFEDDLFILEEASKNYPVGPKAAIPVLVKAESIADSETKSPSPSVNRTLVEQLRVCHPDLLALFEELRQYARSLGDVSEKQLKYWVSFRQLRNFASMWINPKSGEVVLNLNLTPTSITLEDGFSRDVGLVGHWGSGQIEVRVKSAADIEKAQMLVLKSFERS